VSERVIVRARDLVVERSSRASRFELRVPALELRAGEVLCVLGPNGAGKSTLLRALAGLSSPIAGSIEREAGRVTMVFQRPVAFAGTVGHNMRAALYGSGLSRAERDSRVDRALARFGIAALAPRRAVALSGGELRRLALARAFALEPAALLLDEPFEDLDAAAQESLSLDLRQALAETGVAVVLVTHDLRRAVSISDRLAVLHGGCVRQVGTTDEVLEHPATATIARLVGMSNLVPGVVAEDGRGIAIDAEHRLAAACALPPGTPVLAGLRPERLKLDVGRGETEPIGKGIVRRVVSDGLLCTVTIAWAGHELRTHLVAGRGLAKTLAPGDAVLLSAQASDVHVLARDTDADHDVASTSGAA
jgi:ABC-type sulfate/molybdate transport systems ATPase subunit